MDTSQACAWDTEDLWMGRMVLLLGMAEWLCVSSIPSTQPLRTEAALTCLNSYGSLEPGLW